MMPTVTQQLESMRLTMERVVMPALKDDARFAQEQAGLIWATLGWLIDVHESEVRYELAESADYRGLLSQVAALPVAGAADVEALLAEPAVGADGDVAALRDQNRRLKAMAVEALASAEGESKASIRAWTLATARRQAEREAAWYRMTGFTICPAPGGIAEVLASAP